LNFSGDHGSDAVDLRPERPPHLALHNGAHRDHSTDYHNQETNSWQGTATTDFRVSAISDLDPIGAQLSFGSEADPYLSNGNGCLYTEERQTNDLFQQDASCGPQSPAQSQPQPVAK
jgi:hypothetical protein